MIEEWSDGAISNFKFELKFQSVGKRRRESSKQNINSAMEENRNECSVEVLYFARAREVTGLARERWEVGRDWSTAELHAALQEKYPALEEILRVCAWAVNEEYVNDPVPIKHNDKVALIPPISGG